MKEYKFQNTYNWWLVPKAIFVEDIRIDLDELVNILCTPTKPNISNVNEYWPENWEFDDSQFNWI